MASYTGDKKRKKKRIMHKFTMTEISAVDRPAQAGATVVLMKRADDNVEKKFELVSETDGHTHLLDVDDFAMIHKGGHTSYDDDHSHPFVINADSTITIGMSDEHTHSINLTAEQIMEKKLTDEDSLIGKTAKKTADGHDGVFDNGGNNMPLTEKEAADLQKSVKTLETKLATANTIADLNDENKAYYKSLEDSDKETFLAKSADERQMIVDNAKADNPVVYKSLDGTEFFKSDDPRMVGSVKRADSMQKRFDKEVEKNENLALEKRAKNELSHLPGKTADHAQLLKAIDGIDSDSTRENVMNSLKAGNHAMKKNFERRGSGGEEITKTATEELDALAKKYADDHKVDFYKAYDEVTQTAKGQELYQSTLN